MQCLLEDYAMRPAHIRRLSNNDNELSPEWFSGEQGNKISTSGGVSTNSRDTEIAGDVTGRDKLDQSTNGFVIVNGNAVIVSKVSPYEVFHDGQPLMRSKKTKVAERGRKKQVFEVPIIGWIHAGQLAPIVSSAAVAEESILLTSDIVRFQEGLFGLRVCGRSMDKWINDGDVVIMRRQSDAANGDVVAVQVAGIDDRGTLKRFFREKTGLIRLQPESSTDIMPILVDPKRLKVKIVGKLIAIVPQSGRK
jgi:SOS-response transcriptional repressor LexA